MKETPAQFNARWLEKLAAEPCPKRRARMASHYPSRFQIAFGPAAFQKLGLKLAKVYSLKVHKRIISRAPIVQNNDAPEIETYNHGPTLTAALDDLRASVNSGNHRLTQPAMFIDDINKLEKRAPRLSPESLQIALGRLLNRFSSFATL